MGNISKLTPILYDKGETNFNHNGLGRLTKLLKNEIDEVLNGEFEALFEYPANGDLADDIDYGMFIKAKPNTKDEPHIFKIYDYELDTFTQTYLIYARSKNIEDLRSNVILDVNVNGLNPTQAWNQAKNNALGSVVTTFYSDITTPSSVHWEHRTLLSIIAGQQGSMIQYWGGEIKHGVDWVGLYRRRGQDNVTTVRYGKNLDGLKAVYSTKGLVTAIVPYFKKRDGQTIYGNVIESRYINNYPITYYDVVEYSSEDLGLSNEDEYNDNDIKNILNAKSSNYFSEHVGKDSPSINMEISLQDISQTKEYEKFKNFEQIELGDTITVYSHKYKINITAKVQRVVYNGLTDKNELVEVGTVRGSLYDDVREEFNRVEVSLQEGIDHAMASADGKNTIYHGTADPNEVGLVGKNNDTYFRTNGQFKEIWSYLDGQWHLEVGDLTGEQIKADIAEQQQEIEEAKRQAKQDAEQASADAKAHAEAEDARIRGELESEIGGAIALAEQAKQDAVDKANQALTDAKAHADAEVQASKEHFDSLIEVVESDVADAQGTADSAVEQIDTAVVNAGFTSLDDTLQSMNYITMDAEQNAQQAITDANNAYGLAQTSISEAQTAQANSLTALGKVDNALDGVSNLDIRVDDVETELELKADNTFMNEDGELTTLSNAITFNAHRFSSDMSRIESRVESLAGAVNLVVLRDAFNKSWLSGGEVYPNPSVGVATESSDTMREMIAVTPGEQFALSKDTVPGDNYWRINCYTQNMEFITRLTSQANETIIAVPSNAHHIWVSYPQGSYPQIVRGATFVPYRPNIVDQMTSDEVVIFRNEYDEFADKTERRLTTIDSSGGRLDTAELLITQTADGLALKADQTAVNELTGEVESLGTEFDVVAGQVNSKVWMSDLSNLEIGGRNLLLGSDFLYEGSPTTRFGNFTYSDEFYNLIGEDQDVTISVYVEYTNAKVPVANGTSNRIGSEMSYFDSAGGAYGMHIHHSPVNGGSFKGRISRTYNLKNYADDRYMFGLLAHIDADTIKVGYPKIEKGTKATDWTPAPEDTTALINHVESELTQKHDSITATVSSIDGRVATQKTTLDSISSTVSGHSSRLSTVEQTASGLQTTVASKASQSQVTQLANGLSSVVTNLESLGGTNLIEGSNGSTQSNMDYWTMGGNASFLRSFHDFYKNSTESVFMLSTTGTSEVTATSNTRVYVEPNTTYTFSMVGFMNTNVKSVDVHFLMRRKGESSDHTVTMATTQHHLNPSRLDSLTWTFTTPNISNLESGYIRIDNNGTNSEGSSASIYFTNVKLEKGSVATDYSESFTEKASQSQITQLSDNINLRVTKGDVINQINVSTEGILIDGKRTHITGTTTIDNGVIKNAHIYDLHADKINAGTIDTARLNATEIVAQGLTANVVEAKHIKADTALIEKLFATKANIGILTAKTAFIDSIKAVEIDASKISSGTINSARINAIDVVTQGLTADVIESTHILADTALFDKLFTSDLATDRLSAQTAWITNGMFANASIDGAKIQDATIGSAKIAELDVGKISGNVAEFVQTHWNTVAGGSVAISGSGVLSTASDNSQVYIQNGIMGVRNPQGASLGHIGYNYTTNRAFYNIQTSLGTNFSISAQVGTLSDSVRRTMMDIFPGSSETYIRTNDFRHIGATGSNATPFARFSGDVQIDGKITANSSSMDIQQINWRYGSWIYDDSSNSDFRIVGGNRLRFYTRGASSLGSSLAYVVDNTHMYVHRTLSMEGNDITNQSDRRLKFNIEETIVNSLEEINSMTFVEFDRTNGNHDEIGVIAQDTPSLALYDSERDTWSINSSKQIMMNSHAIQQMYFEFDERVESNEDKIHQLQKELSKANRRIEELESVM